MSDLVSIEVLADHAASRGPREGFLHLKRYDLVNVHADGSRSEVYPCDMVSRRFHDAVAVVVWGRGPDGRVQVVLRENLRPPVYLRRFQTFVQPDTRQHLLVSEIVAGLIEEGDAGEDGVARRAALEVVEEVGFRVRADETHALGAPLFPSPGITDEKVYFRHVEVDLAVAGPPLGDGSVMERAGRVFTLPLDEALARCRSGALPDMKTELGLRRLAEHLATSRTAHTGSKSPR